MKKKRALAASRDPEVYTFDDPTLEPNTMSMIVGDSHEMLKITPEGFWVRGQKVPQDENEARLVYNAFREFLTYSALTRSY